MTQPIQFPTGNPDRHDQLQALEEALSKQPEKIIVKEEEPEEEFTDVGGYFDHQKVRKAVEARCSELKFEDLVTTGKIQQKVPIRPKKLEVVLQTITGEDEVFATEQAYLEARGTVTHPKIYLLMEICMGVHSINGKPLPAYMNDKGERDPKMFRERWKFLANLPAPIIKRLHENYLWFVERVDQLTVLDDLKNG